MQLLQQYTETPADSLKGTSQTTSEPKWLFTGTRALGWPQTGRVKALAPHDAAEGDAEAAVHPQGQAGSDLQDFIVTSENLTQGKEAAAANTSSQLSNAQAVRSKEHARRLLQDDSSPAETRRHHLDENLRQHHKHEAPDGNSTDVSVPEFTVNESVLEVWLPPRVSEGSNHTNSTLDNEINLKDLGGPENRTSAEDTPDLGSVDDQQMRAAREQAETAAHLKEDGRAYKGPRKPIPSDWETRPKIYIYEPHPEYQKCTWDLEGYEFHLYGAEKAIPKFLPNTSYVVHDPSEADLFYFPAYFYCKGGMTGLPGQNNLPLNIEQTSELAVKWLRTLPYYDRHNGTDHIFTLTYDHGFCGFNTYAGSPIILKNSIILSHWGLTTSEILCSWVERMLNYGHCDNREVKSKFDKVDQKNKLPCFVPGKDVVITHPSFDDQEWVNETGFYRKAENDVEIELGAEGSSHKLRFEFPKMLMSRDLFLGQREGLIDASMPEPPKPTVFFFNGGVIEPDPAYSHGARQTVFKLFKDLGNWTVWDRKEHETFIDRVMVDMGLSKFCLAATGAGFGARLKLCILERCIPVVISDDVEMEYEEVLPYQDFAVRIPQYAIYRLPELLDKLINEPGRVAVMHQRLACLWRFFKYSPPHGQSLELIMCALRRRVYGANKIYPMMDWQTCTFTCGPQPYLPGDAPGTERYSLADPEQRVALMPWRVG